MHVSLFKCIYTFTSKPMRVLVNLRKNPIFKNNDIQKIRIPITY